MNQIVDIRPQAGAAVLDSAHLGDIEGAFGTILQHDTGARLTWRRHLVTLLAIIGPGLIVMAGDNDAGVLPPSATVFLLLLLCNDRTVLGPWVNRAGLNIFTGAVIAVLVVLSVILTAAVLYPDITDRAILWILAGGALSALITGSVALLTLQTDRDGDAEQPDGDRATWRMPPLAQLAPARLTPAKRIWLGVLRFYLLAATILVVVRVAQIALGQG